MANLIARIAVLLVLAAAGMVLADRKEKIFCCTQAQKSCCGDGQRKKENECKPNIRLRAPMQKCRSDVF